MNFGIEQIFGLIAFPAAMIAAALCDVLTLRIPNWISVFVLLAFLPAAYFSRLSGVDIGLHAVVCVAAFGFGLFAFAMGWIGGGDGKLLAACALWFGPHDIAAFAVAFSIVGGGIALILMTIRHMTIPVMFSRRAWIARLWDVKVGVPYALAFAAGGLLIYPQSDLWSRFGLH